MVRIFHVQTGKDLQIVKMLFEEYAASLDFDLCFQGFEKGLANLPGDYGLPKDSLPLCKYKDQSGGLL